MKNILIAPWGNFSAWKEVIYSFDGIKKESKSSLSAIYEKINPDKTYILVLDTLSNINNNKNYKDIKKEVKEKAINFIDENLNIDNYEVIVCPGVGTFPNGKFYGNLADYYSYVLYELSKRFDGDVKVHLDLTHGINFMPVLTYRVIKDLLDILSIKNLAKLVVYNSDPYVGSEKEILNIHIVEDITIKPTFRLDGIPSLNLLANSPYLINKKEIGAILKNVRMNPKINELKLLKQNINAVLASLVYALPLIYSTFYVDYEKIKSIIDEIINIFIDNIEINPERKELTRKLKFTESFNTLVKAYFTLKVCKIPELIKDELSLEEINLLIDSLLKENPNSQLVKNELSSIHTILTRKYSKEDLNEIAKKWIPMYKLRREDVDKFKLRNFIAHAGFEKSITEIYPIIEIITSKNKDEINLSKKTLLRYCKEYIVEENGIKRFIYKYKDKHGNVEETKILEKLEEVFLNRLNK